MNFLFTEMFEIFQDAGLEDKFIDNLRPFIVASKFSDTPVRDELKNKIVMYYVN